MTHISVITEYRPHELCITDKGADMATLDVTPLKSMAVAYMEKDERSITLAEDGILDEICYMLADFDARFIQYPMLAAAFVARCAMYGRADVQELKSLLDLLSVVDVLKGKN